MGKKERYEVLYEDLIDKVKAIAEGHQILLRAIEENTNRLEKRFDDSNAELKDSIRLLHTKLGDTRKELGDTRKELGDTRKELGDTRKELGRKIDKISDGVYHHEIRIEALEKKAA